MSSREVPRRESPWGTPEGDHRQPKAHRCNDRAEDVIQVSGNPSRKKKAIIRLARNIFGQKAMIVGIYEDHNFLKIFFKANKGCKERACFEGNPFKTVPGPFKLFWRCMRSKPGEEPTEPFTYLQLDPPKREVELE